MAKKPETIFAEKVHKLLNKTFGKDIVLFNIQQVAINGTPDILGVLKGRFIALELKTESGKASKIQLLKLAKIERAGGYSAVVFPSTLHFVMAELKAIVSFV